MSLDLHLPDLPLIGHRFGAAADIPDMPGMVYGPVLLNADATVHRVWDCGPSLLVDAFDALHRGVGWCDKACCWPRGRCGTCGFPSGPSDTCLRCASRQHELERRLGDAA